MARMRGANKVRAYQREHVAAREALERRFDVLMEIDPAYERLVTNEGGREEPFHRWHSYRQAFSPELVRRFLDEAGTVDGPILDPFSGSGTTAVECARRGRAAVGVDAVPVLAWLLKAKFAREAPPFSNPPSEAPFTSWAAAATSDAQRAAVLLAAGRTVTGTGRPKVSASPDDLVNDVYGVIAEDLQEPLPPIGGAVVADARALPLASGSCGGLLTSPPYLSRYDYARINAPMERLFRATEGRALRERQVRAAVGPKARAQKRGPRVVLPDAVREAAAALEDKGRSADASVVRAYFDDLHRSLAEFRRVLKAGAPCWIVIGGADIEREYVPSDLVCAAQAEVVGFEVERVVEARKLRWSLRRLGGLNGVAPREAIVMLRRGEDRFDEDPDA
jgi:hypothetical protein